MMSCALGAFRGSLAGAGSLRRAAQAEAEVSCGQALPVPLKPFSGRAANAERRGSAAVFLRLRYFFGAVSRDWAFSFTQ